MEDELAQVKARPTGAAATIGRIGPAKVSSDTGGTVTLNVAASDPAFSPLDLLYAAIAGCLVVSARMAVSEKGLLDGLQEVRAVVHGHKAVDGPARVDRLNIELEILGEFDDETRAALIARAEELCTVSNTVKGHPAFVLNGH